VQADTAPDEGCDGQQEEWQREVVVACGEQGERSQPEEGDEAAAAGNAAVAVTCCGSMLVGAGELGDVEPFAEGSRRRSL
jgi:hypothetical protein